MIIFHYDKTFDGLLTALFDAYNRKTFPDRLLAIGEQESLFVTESFTVVTDEEKSKRVWKGIEKKTMEVTRNMIGYVWLSETDDCDELLFRYLKKTFDSRTSIEMNFADNDVLNLRNLAKKVNKEAGWLVEFIRFQKAADDIFFAPVEPIYNSLSLTLPHLKDRFSDQKWIVYDVKRNFGYYYDLKNISEITLDTAIHFPDGKLDEKLLAEDEKMFQQLWKGYFISMTIKERINPRLHRHNLPKRFWKYLTEKQD